MAGYIGNYGNVPLQTFGPPPTAATGMPSGITPGMILAHIALVRQGLQKEQEASAKEKAARKEARAQANAPQPLTPFQSLMAMAQGGGGGPDLSAYTKALAQSRAQEEQNQADIGSWYSQLGGQYAQAGKANRKTSKKMRKEAGAMNRSLVKAQADKGVGYALGIAGQSEGSYLRELGLGQAAFDRRLAADASAQGAYQQMVQARLGAQERAGIRDDMRAAAQSSQGESWDRMMQVLGLMSSEQRDAFLQGQDPRMAGAEAPDFGVMRDALGDSADTFFKDVKDPSTGDTYEAARRNDFPQILAMLRDAVGGAGMNINDPAVREAFRRWVSGNFATRYNAANAEGAPDWYLSGQSFRQY